MPSDAMIRLMDASGCKSQLELANFLGVNPSSVASGKKRGTVPPAWLLAALKSKGINPEWVSTGAGPQYLIPAPEETYDAAWRYSIQVVLTDPSKLLSQLHMRELLGEAYRRSLLP